MEKKSEVDRKKALVEKAFALTSALSIAIALYFFIYRFTGVVKSVNKILAILMPFIYCAAFAYMLSPLCNFFEKRFAKIFRKLKKANQISENLAIFLSVIIALTAIFLFFVAVIPQLYESMVGIVNKAPQAYYSGREFISDLLKDYPEQEQYIDSSMSDIYARFQSWMRTDMLNTLGQLAGSVGNSINNVVTAFKNVFLGLLVAVYVLSCRKKFVRQSKMALFGLCPEKIAKIVYEEVVYADKMFSGFLYGKIVDSAIIGLICFLGCIVMGLEFPLLISVIVGVTNIIPFFGPYIGAIPCALILLIVNPMHSLWFLIFIMILQQVDGNVIGKE